MEQWKIVVLTGVISFVVSGVTAWITSKLSFRGDIKKYLHSKREVLYIEFYSELDKFLMNKYLIYDRAYLDKFFSFKPKLNLIASKNVLKEYEKILLVFRQVNYTFDEFCSANDPRLNANPGETITTAMIDNYEQQLKVFKRRHLPAPEEVESLINELTDTMRKDLGSK